MALTKLTKNLIDGTFGTEWDSTIQTSNFTAVAGKGYFVNTTSAEITVTLPAGVVGNEVIIQDYAGTFATNNVIITANGSEKIQGDTLDGKLTTNNLTATIVYQDATKGWTGQDISLIPLETQVEYLVAAGGGGGGKGSGGGAGGAGGYRTNFSGTAVILSNGTNYIVTVGAGGAGSTLAATRPGNGSNSVFDTITSTGGGGGGCEGGGKGVGSSGGSGGGGNYGDSYGSGNTPSTTPSQGNNGGAGGSGGSDYAGGGGGGASAAGSNGPGSGNGGNGGAGTSNSITGSAVTYAGGGGGGSQDGGNAGTPGTGGAGGGGNGMPYHGENPVPPTSAQNGTVNTGGGAGGGASSDGTSSPSGGSGLVILRYPSTSTLTNPGGGLTTSILNGTVGSDKYTTFTAGTGNIQLN
jgi:hypothetical protein